MEDTEREGEVGKSQWKGEVQERCQKKIQTRIMAYDRHGGDRRQVLQSSLQNQRPSTKMSSTPQTNDKVMYMYTQKTILHGGHLMLSQSESINHFNPSYQIPKTGGVKAGWSQGEVGNVYRP